MYVCMCAYVHVCVCVRARPALLISYLCEVRCLLQQTGSEPLGPLDMEGVTLALDDKHYLPEIWGGGEEQQQRNNEQQTRHEWK